MAPDVLVSEGLTLMLLGMGVVFVFLTLLVLVTSAMSALVIRFSDAPPLPDGDAPSALTQDARRLAAITAAVHAHRRRSGGDDRSSP